MFRDREIAGIIDEIGTGVVRAMTEVFPLERAAEAYELMMSGKARFRVVLSTAH